MIIVKDTVYNEKNNITIATIINTDFGTIMSRKKMVFVGKHDKKSIEKILKEDTGRNNKIVTTAINADFGTTMGRKQKLFGRKHGRKNTKKYQKRDVEGIKKKKMLSGDEQSAQTNQSNEFNKTSNICKGSPLVSIVIPTYNRGERLTNACLPSLLNQTYKNIEIIIVGDCCNDDTEERIKNLKESRIVFKNLDVRTPYPPKARLAGRGGRDAMHLASDMANGEWIKYSNDCDIHFPNQIEKCLSFAMKNNFDMVCGGIAMETKIGVWVLHLNRRHYWHTTWFYKEYLRKYRYSNTVHDSGVVECMKRDGVKIGHIDEILALAPLRPGQVTRGCKYRLAYEEMVNELGLEKTREIIKKYKIKKRPFHR